MKRLTTYIPQVFILIVTLILLILILPGLKGSLTGTLTKHTIPSDYVTFENFLHLQNSFSRTLWVPVFQKYGFYQSEHPAVSAEDFYHVTSVLRVMQMLQKANSEKLLQENSIGYVILPFDNEKEIFITDRKYDSTLYQRSLLSLQKISYLRELPGFGRIHVFRVSNARDHFWTNEGSVSYIPLSVVKYIVNVKSVKKGTVLTFTDTFDQYWVAKIGMQNISSQPFENHFNSFVLPKNGNYSIVVSYLPQQWVFVSQGVSGVTLLLLIGILLFTSLRKKP